MRTEHEHEIETLKIQMGELEDELCRLARGLSRYGLRVHGDNVVDNALKVIKKLFKIKIFLFTFSLGHINI